MVWRFWLLSRPAGFKPRAIILEFFSVLDALAIIAGVFLFYDSCFPV